jgi:hypothetical protein
VKGRYGWKPDVTPPFAMTEPIPYRRTMTGAVFPLSAIGWWRLVGQSIVLSTTLVFLTYVAIVADVPSSRASLAIAGLSVAVVAFLILLRDASRVLKHHGAGLIFTSETIEVIFPRSRSIQFKDVLSVNRDRQIVILDTVDGIAKLNLRNLSDPDGAYSRLSVANSV